MDKTPEKSLKTLFAKPELDVKNTVIISWQSNMHAVAWCSGRSDLLICGSPGEMDYGNEAAVKNKEPGNLLAVKDFLALVNRKDRSEILLVFSADEKRVKYFRFTGAKRFQADHMVVLQLKPGATVAMAKY